MSLENVQTMFWNFLHPASELGGWSDEDGKSKEAFPVEKK